MKLSLVTSSPSAYRHYLLWMGEDHKGAFRGTDCFSKDVVENTEYVSELLQENSVQWRLPDAFVSFFCHQGYMIAWFDLEDEADDPQCWFFREGSHAEPVFYGNFSAFLLCEMEQIAETVPSF